MKFPPNLEITNFPQLLVGAYGRREAGDDRGRVPREERLKQVCACPPSVVESEKDLK